MLNTSSIQIKDACSHVFEHRLNTLEREGSQVLISHFGELTQELINSLAEGAEEILIGENEKKAIIKRVFSILIEGLQNIRVHGIEDKNGKKNGLLIFYKKENNYYVVLGNLIEKSREESVEKRLHQLNSLDEETLKKVYLDVLSNGIISNKGGAGLGFITIRMKSKSNLDFDFFHLNDELSLFVVDVAIQTERTHE
jgi:hypothetical protein